ncbi:MAG: hypothetical protein Q8Q31_05035 [Nanoarchaeota archaeon]|nr:hypothetical protein [Nanoarchaeota archaeon]
MPRYLYYCKRCDTTNEYALPSSNDRPVECANSECGVDGRFLERQWHGQTVNTGHSGGKLKSMDLTNLVTGQTVNFPLKFVASHVTSDGGICQHYKFKSPS